ncbi:unnamed protein product [Eretmochelys imbricata]
MIHAQPRAPSPRAAAVGMGGLLPAGAEAAAQGQAGRGAAALRPAGRLRPGDDGGKLGSRGNGGIKVAVYLEVDLEDGKESLWIIREEVPCRQTLWKKAQR